MATAKTFKDIPKADINTLTKLLKKSFKETYENTSSQDVNAIVYEVYDQFKNLVLENIKTNKKLFTCKFVDIIKNDDYEFQKFVFVNVKQQITIN